MENCQLEDVFPSPIFRIKMGWDTSFLYEKCIELRNKDKDNNIEKSNVGGWQSRSIINCDYILDSDHIRHLSGVINSCSEHIGLPKLEIDNYWVNINGYKDYNSFHDHPRSILSGAYYIKTPENCGAIEFSHPMTAILQRDWDHQNIAFNRFTSSLWRYRVSEDSLLLFPSWLNHRVLPNLSSEERVSISFNSTYSK